jgi:hypothetical protein
VQAPTTRSGRLLCQKRDRIPITEDVPALGIRKGDEGIVRKLDLYNDTVFAFLISPTPPDRLGDGSSWRSNHKVRSFTTTPR